MKSIPTDQIQAIISAIEADIAAGFPHRTGGLTGAAVIALLKELVGLRNAAEPPAKK